jgi:hypothetical protein
MDSSLQPFLVQLDNLTDEFHDVREGVQKAVGIAEQDPEMALTRLRKVLERVVREVYQRRLQEDPGTRPLENLAQRLVKEGFLPDRLDAYATAVRKLGNVGTHTFGEVITAADVRLSLSQLQPVLLWYFDAERPDAIGRVPGEKAPAAAEEAAPQQPGRPSRRPLVLAGFLLLVVAGLLTGGAWLALHRGEPRTEQVTGRTT